MRVISSAELRSNMKKYLDLAAKEQIIIQRGKNESFRLTKADFLEEEEDIKRAISMEDFRSGAKAHIERMYSK